MKKIAFLVEDDFINLHVGVRNYIFSLYLSLKDFYDIDFIYESKNSNLSFKRIIISDDFIAQNGFYKNVSICGNKNDILKSLKTTNFNEEEFPINKDIYFQYIGDIEEQGYDALIITNPWLINFNQMLPAKKVFGLVYDTIPIEYFFKDSPIKYDKSHFAFKHHNGFKYYNKYCDNILFISKKSLNFYKEFYKNSLNNSELNVIEPIASQKFCNLKNFDSKYLDKNTIILTTPFEIRKGIKIIPEYINSICDLNSLIIYGNVNRTKFRDIKDFFKSLREDIQITWYKEITTDSLIKLFLKSSLCLFCSDDEGLGLPIIESQLCGCKVLCYDKPPMSDLVIEKDKFIVKNDKSLSIKNIDYCLKTKYDKNQLIKSANKKFNNKQFLTLINKIL